MSVIRYGHQARNYDRHCFFLFYYKHTHILDSRGPVFFFVLLFFIILSGYTPILMYRLQRSVVKGAVEMVILIGMRYTWYDSRDDTVY